MKVLKVGKECFTWLGICPIDDQTNHRRQFLHNMFSSLAVFILGLVIVSSSITSFHYGKSDLSNALFVAVPGVSSIKLFASLTSIIVFRRKVTLFFEKLQTFYNQIESAKSWRFFVKANEMSNIISIMLTICFPLFVGITQITMAATSALYCYITGGYVSPWNQHTLVGWMGTISFNIIGGTTYFIVDSMILSLFIGITLYFQTFHKHFAILVKEIGIDDSNEPPAVKQHKEKVHVMQMLREIIQLHIIAKQLFVDAAEIYSVTIFFKLICAVGCLSLTIFQMNLAIQKMLLSILVVFLAMFIAFMNDAFVFCYFGAMTTNNFFKYFDRLCEVHWNDLPVILQTQFVIIMTNFQRPLEYRDFRMVSLNLVIFLKIIKTVFSYYSAFITLNKD